jgi:RNA polymerase sigma factor (sigma-70 family)
MERMEETGRVNAGEERHRQLLVRELAGEARRDLGKLLEQLPDRQRLPIVHMKLEGLSVAEAARVTGMSESAVKVGVHRGLKALAAMIRGDA